MAAEIVPYIDRVGHLLDERRKAGAREMFEAGTFMAQAVFDRHAVIIGRRAPPSRRRAAAVLRCSRPAPILRTSSTAERR